MIPVVTGALGTVTKGLLQGLEDLEIKGRVETIQITVLLRSARILSSNLETEETYCHSDSSGKPSANTGAKNSQISKKKNNTTELNDLISAGVVSDKLGISTRNLNRKKK